MTANEPIVTISHGNPAKAHQLTFSAVQRIIYDNRVQANFGLAASVATQLADQLPGNPWAQFVAAESLYLYQQPERARVYVDRALAIDPGHVASLVLKSRLYVFTGDADRALQLIEAAVALAPEDARLYGIKAEVLTNAGQADAARDCFHASIRLDPGNADALVGLAQLPGDHFGDELIAAVESALEANQFGADARVKAHFALAHAYDSKGDVASHFAHLNAGNQLKSRSLDFDPDLAGEEARRIIEYFSADFFARRQGMGRSTGDTAPNIVFIVGFPRCGSTLVEQILSSHPQVSAAGETYALKHAIVEFQEVRGLSPGFPCWVDEQADEAFEEIAGLYLKKVEAFNHGGYLTDKLLDNYRLIGAIHLVFPEAAVINVQRNPVDVCYSCYKRLFHLNTLPFTYSLEHLASHYRVYRQLIRHWDEVLPGKIHHIQYEELIRDQENVTRDLLERCGLAWDPSCLQFHESGRTVHTASNAQVRQPLYTDAIDRWKTRADYLGPLLDLTND